MTALAAMLPAVGATGATAGTVGMSALASGLSSVGASTAVTGALSGMGASAAATLAGGGFSLMPYLSTGLSLASAGMNIMGGYQQSQSIAEQTIAQSRALERQAADQESAAKQEELRGKQEANNILDELNKTLAAQRLAFATNGIDPFEGTAQAVAKNTSRSADIALGTSRSDAMLRSMTRRRQAGEMLTQRGIITKSGFSNARSALVSGVGNALIDLNNFSNRRAARG